MTKTVYLDACETFNKSMKYSCYRELFPHSVSGLHPSIFIFTVNSLAFEFLIAITKGSVPLLDFFTNQLLVHFLMIIQ